MFNIENRRYTGSKMKLKEWIHDIIINNCNGDTFLDLFAGTGIIGYKVSKDFKNIIFNDILYSNNCIYKAFFKKSKWNEKKIKNYIDIWNEKKTEDIQENYISINYGGLYFSQSNAKKIGYIREEIEKIKKEINEKEYNILITSLIYSTDKVANTVGHYDAFLKKQDKKNFVLEIIKESVIDDVKIYREDANELVNKLNVDVVYIDPPYNSRQYSRFYHILETLVKWDMPELYGVAKKPEKENMSDYCTVKATDAFSSLINNLNCKFIVVSYNNTYDSKSGSSRNKIKQEDIINILNLKGNLQIFERSHKCFNSGKTNFENHKEYIYLVEVKK